MNISIIVPCYNEADNVAHAYRNIKINLPQTTFRYEIIFVNDGSTDNTKSIIQDLKAADPYIQYLEFPRNRGYGAAVRAGFTQAQFEYLVYIDGDCQYDFNDFLRMITLMVARQYAVVGGVRKKRHDRIWRRALALLGKIICAGFFKISLEDIDCGFKLIRRNILKEISLVADSGLLFSLELYYKCIKKKLPVAQIPIRHLPRTAGYSKGVNLTQYRLALSDIMTKGKTLWQI